MGSDFYAAKDLQDPFYTLLLSGGIQDNRVGGEEGQCGSSRSHTR